MNRAWKSKTFWLPVLLLIAFVSYQNCSPLSGWSTGLSSNAPSTLTDRSPAAVDLPSETVAILTNPQASDDDFVYPWPYSKTMLGTAHASPLYNPSSLLDQSVLYHGALDARQMGFNVLKIWLGPEIFNPRFYRFDGDQLSSTPLPEMLNFSEYQKVLALPYEVLVLEYDNPEIWWSSIGRRIDEGSLQRIEEETYTMALRLLHKFAGTGKIFILQNHEGDNHINDFTNAQYVMKHPSFVPPTTYAYENYRNYFQARQSGMRRARKEAQATNVAIYQLCEVSSVIRSYQPSLMAEAAKQAALYGQTLTTTSLTTEVLPSVECDLYGYSAYESVFEKDPQVLLNSLEFIRSKTKPSVAFGRNNVVVSEIGIPEQDAGFRPTLPEFVKKTRSWIRDLKLPMFLFWVLYDNECATGDCVKPDNLNLNIEMKQARGFWLRDISGHYSQLMNGVKDLVEAQVPDSKSVQMTYQLLLGRSASEKEVQYATWAISQVGREGYYLDVSKSPEARQKLVRDVFQKVLKKQPTTAQLEYWAQFIQGQPLAAAANTLFLKGPALDR